ncbi:DUF4238 domain-containing protein [Kitasatospora purpeofusca]|uniref:DUF4238 domain-containing protein n=1 Tax=Kitasatospora purpeofusca TaxID=67352 RepID=UPI0035E11014
MPQVILPGTSQGPRCRAGYYWPHAEEGDLGRASSGKRAAHEAGKTRDHTVPQMYLRRFAEHRGRRQHELTVRRIAGINRPFPAMTNNILAERGYYWGTSLEGVPHHAVEELFSQLEGSVTPVFAEMLDAPEGALPERWPLTDAERLQLAWWISAQILRTTRQRKRLAFADSPTGGGLEAPADIAVLAANNPHLRYIVEHLAALALTVFGRPWGLGFSDICLLTSDVPVVLLNGHDARNQLAAAAICDILLPLDPHRLLFLPGAAMQQHDPGKRSDHRMKIEGGVGMALVQTVYDVADAFVLHHPKHDPWHHWKPSGPRQPAPWTGDDHPGPMYVMEYGLLAPHLTVERRWLTEHPSP